jgi:hypothetical protein
MSVRRAKRIELTNEARIQISQQRIMKPVTEDRGSYCVIYTHGRGASITLKELTVYISKY